MSIDAANAGAYYIRGCAFEKIGNIDQSVEDFTTVLGIDPNHINAAYARGACENKRGNFAEAIEDYNMALEKDQERPTSPNGNRRIKVKNMNYILDMPLGKQKAEGHSMASVS
jgi:tetratricopeptide (TPR) repeat protein